MVYPHKWSPVTGRAQDSESTPAEDRRYTTGPRKSVLLKCVKNYENRRSSSKDVLNQMQWPRLIMAALWNRADCYIFILWFLSIFYLFLFPRLISAAAHWMSTVLPVLHTWCGLSANLECRSETCCTRLAENTGRKKVAKNRDLGTIGQLCRDMSSQLRHLSTVGKTC